MYKSNMYSPEVEIRNVDLQDDVRLVIRLGEQVQPPELLVVAVGVQVRLYGAHQVVFFIIELKVPNFEFCLKAVKRG